jgi:putative redox protein
MEVKVSWNGPSGMSFRAQTGSGHMVAMDGAPEGGGHNLAPRPMEMVLLGTDPKIFTKINFHFVITGRNLKPAAVERAVKLSHEKYCSASIMLAAMAEITHSVEIIEA